MNFWTVTLPIYKMMQGFYFYASAHEQGYEWRSE